MYINIIYIYIHTHVYVFPQIYRLWGDWAVRLNSIRTRTHENRNPGGLEPPSSQMSYASRSSTSLSYGSTLGVNHSSTPTWKTKFKTDELMYSDF